MSIITFLTALPKFCCNFLSCFTSTDGPEVTGNSSSSGEGTHASSSSSTIPKVCDLTDGIRKDVNADADDGKEVKVDLAGLMEHISKLLEIRKKKLPRKNLGAHNFWPTTSTGFLNIKEFLSGGKELASSIESIIPSQAKTVVVDLLRGIAHASLATAGLLVVANILERFQDVSENEEECLSLLDEMNTLAKYVKQLQENSKLKNQMDDSIRKATELIVEASILCCTQIDSSIFGRVFSASVNKKELSKFKEELNRTYRNMQTQMDMCIFNAITSELRQVHREFPAYAVGIDEAVEEVTKSLDLESKKTAVAVVVHGLGGMGKTTLADAVYARMFAREKKEVYKYSMVRLFDDITSTPDIIKLQTYIFKDLRRGTKEEGEPMPDIRTFEDGQGEIGRLLEQEAVLIYIDNVLCRGTLESGRDALTQLLPMNMGKAKKARFIITARDTDAVSISLCKEHGLEPKYYPIRTLSDMEAKKLFEEKLYNKKNEITPDQKDELVKLCGGIPKLLTVVAGFISDSEVNAQEAYKTVLKERKKHWKEGTIAGKIECYVFAYKKLDETLRDPFLDICSFFQGWDWEALSIVVGEVELKRLEKRGLVTRDAKSMTARVHDVILTIGQQNAQGNRFRITSASEFEDIIMRKEDEEIKGIWFTGDRVPLHINAETLDSMYSSVRILQLGTLTAVEGKCKNIFKNLVFFYAGISHLPFDVSKFKEFEELTYLSYKPKDLRDLSQMPSSIRHIEFAFDPKSCDFQISAKCLQQISNLRGLRLQNAKLEKLPPELQNLSALQLLILRSCQCLEELPSSLGELSSLRFLDLSFCTILKYLPSSLGKLSALQKLDLRSCERLEELPSSLGDLSSLRFLDLPFCTSLKYLPSSLGKLSALQKLDLSSCKRLEALPSSLGDLSLLRFLDISECISLKDLPYDLGKLSSLVELYVYGCIKLSSLPESIGMLKSLDSVMVLSRTGLKELPDGFCNLSFITYLNMSYCPCLEKLPERFGEVTNLTNLNLCYCGRLKNLPESFGQLKYLEHLNLSYCEILEELCIDFHCLSSLRVLSLDSCKMLKKLPENFHCVTSLELLSLRDCPMLEGRSMDSIVKIKTLQTVNIRKSPMLEEGWEEIRRQGDQCSWSFVVLTGEGSKEHMPMKILHSKFDSILTHGRVSDLPPNTLLLVMYDDGFCSSLIEENIDDIQTNFEMIYFGNHFDKLPKKMAKRILGHAPANSNVQSLFRNVLAAVAATEELTTIDDVLRGDFQMSVKIVSDEKGDKYLSGWELLSGASVEEFVIKKCGRYLKLKQLVEKPRESNLELLRELFASGEEESSLGFPKNDASGKVVLAELKGKTILLDIRPAIMCSDIPLQSLKEMYVAEKERLNFEIITIPIMQEDTESDFLEQLSTQVPWLVHQNPGQLTSVIKFFLVEDCAKWLLEGLLQEDRWKRKWDSWYSGVIRVIESNGTIAAYNPGVLRMVNTWGVEAYPFTEEKSKELKEKERHQMEAMSNLMLPFSHLGSLADQVKASMFKGKMICLYTSHKRLTDCTKYVLTELSDKLQIIYIPQFGQKLERGVHFTNAISAFVDHLGKLMPQDEIQGMFELNISQHEAMRFWAYIFSLKECIDKMDDNDKQLDGIRKKLLHSINHGYLEIMIIMDEDGEFVRTLKVDFLERLCKENPKDIAKQLIQQLIKGPKECRKETLLELE